MEAEPIPVAPIDEEEGDNGCHIEELRSEINESNLIPDDDDLFGLGGTDSGDEDDDDDDDILGGNINSDINTQKNPIKI